MYCHHENLKLSVRKSRHTTKGELFVYRNIAVCVACGKLFDRLTDANQEKAALNNLMMDSEIRMYMRSLKEIEIENTTKTIKKLQEQLDELTKKTTLE